jgi:hypothetical protein
MIHRRIFKVGELVLPKYHGATVRTFGIILDENITGRPEYYIYWFGNNIYNWQYARDIITIYRWRKNTNEN